MATLRNLAISLHRLAGATNIAAASRHLSRHPHRVLPLLRKRPDQLCQDPGIQVEARHRSTRGAQRPWRASWLPKSAAVMPSGWPTSSRTNSMR